MLFYGYKKIVEKFNNIKLIPIDEQIALAVANVKLNISCVIWDFGAAKNILTIGASVNLQLCLFLCLLSCTNLLSYLA